MVLVEHNTVIASSADAVVRVWEKVGVGGGVGGKGGKAGTADTKITVRSSLAIENKPTG